MVLGLNGEPSSLDASTERPCTGTSREGAEVEEALLFQKPGQWCPTPISVPGPFKVLLLTSTVFMDQDSGTTKEHSTPLVPAYMLRFPHEDFIQVPLFPSTSPLVALRKNVFLHHLQNAFPSGSSWHQLMSLNILSTLGHVPSFVRFSLCLIVFVGHFSSLPRQKDFIIITFIFKFCFTILLLYVNFPERLVEGEGESSFEK